MPGARANETKFDRTPEQVKQEKIVLIAMNLLATANLVWFYLYRVPSYVDLVQYEQGLERMPFQARVLMEWPLRWAHSSHAMEIVAGWLNGMYLWLPRKVLPEDVMEFAIYLPAVIVAGLVTRDLYLFHSKRRRLTGYVYPFFLVMATVSYCMEVHHFFRFLYDVPSLGLFACGLYLIYRRRSLWLFALVFAVATVNRETSIFLLVFFVLSYCVKDDAVVWKRALSWRVGGTTVLLAAFWMAWHVWVTRHFAGLKSESAHHIFLNFAFLIWPLCWPQVFGIAAYTLLPLLLFKTQTRNTELRLWAWVVPLWCVFMFYFGILSEVRLFGELIPLFVCMGMLLAEERLFP